jgi:tetratricopeptide (TPR) repeat protein
LSLLTALFLLLRAWPLAAQTQPNPASDFRALASHANAARDANDLEAALALYKSALTLQPGWKEGWWSLGTIQYDRSSYAEAAQAFQKVVTLAPKDGTAWAMLELCEFELRDQENALKHLENGMSLGITHDSQLRYVILYHEAVLLEGKGMFQEAEETLDRVCSDGVQNREVAQALGMAQLRIRQPSSARAPDAALTTGVGEAECLTAQNKFDEARQILDRLVNENPQVPNLHYAYGKLLPDLNESQPAVEQFEAEIKSQPGDVYSRLQIAAVKYRADSAGGLPYAEEAMKLNPRLPFAHYLLGLLLLDTRNYDRAIQKLEIARQAIPREPSVYFALGAACAAAGRKLEAADARQAFLRLSREEAGGPAARFYDEGSSGAIGAGLGGQIQAGRSHSTSSLAERCCNG